MKKIIITIAIICASLATYCQTINGTKLKDIESDYIQIVGVEKLMSSKINIRVDFGQQVRYFKAKDVQLRDENDKQVIFNSMIDALNFFSDNGYSFVNAYAISMGSSNVYHYLLRKKLQ